MQHFIAAITVRSRFQGSIRPHPRWFTSSLSGSFNFVHLTVIGPLVFAWQAMLRCLIEMMIERHLRIKISSLFRFGRLIVSFRLKKCRVLFTHHAKLIGFSSNTGKTVFPSQSLRNRSTFRNPICSAGSSKLSFQAVLDWCINSTILRVLDWPDWLNIRASIDCLIYRCWLQLIQVLIGLIHSVTSVLDWLD